MLWFRATDRSGSDTAGRYLSILFLPTTTVTGAVVAEPGGIAVGRGMVAGGGAIAGAVTATAAAVSAVSLWKLFFFFLKIGAVLYGSGYVLVAFLEGGLVRGYGWLTQAQLMDAIAMGQLTPGPVLSTATFVGYVVSGLPGAAVATLGIFLPSFGFVLLVNRHIPRLRESAWMSAFLDAVNVAALGLMAAVTIQLGMGVLTSWAAWAILGIAAVLTLRYRVNAAWLVCGSAVAGWLIAPLA
jgi:chromate transporter